MLGIDPHPLAKRERQTVKHVPGVILNLCLKFEAINLVRHVVVHRK